MVKEVGLDILEQQLQFLLEGKAIREGPVDICEDGKTGPHKTYIQPALLNLMSLY